MAISLRTNELIKAEVNFHWSTFILAKAWAAFGAFVWIIEAAMLALGATGSEGPKAAPTLLTTAVIFFGPFAYKWLQNKNKRYILTTQRLYIEEGILSKSKRDIPLEKINDLTMNQGLIQRLFGAGNIIVLTGNDKPLKIFGIEKPEEFKTAISETSETKSARAA